MFQFFNQIICVPLGYVMDFLYKITNDYGLVLILITIFVRICLIPLGIKQHKSMAKTQEIQPKLKALQQKYANDKEKLNEEMMKLYQESGASPMAGCLPLLIQLPILYGLIQVIYHPIQYMRGLFPEGLEAVRKAVEAKGLQIAGNTAYEELAVANADGRLDFNFLGIDISKIPSVDGKTDFLVWILPVLAVLVTFFSGRITQKMTGNNGASSQMGMMNWLMPIMTAFFTYNMPGSASLYWFMSTAVSVAQSVILAKVFRKDAPQPVLVEEKPAKKEKNPNPYKQKKKRK